MNNTDQQTTNSSAPKAMSETQRKDFADAVLYGWERAMSAFFSQVDAERRKRDLTIADAEKMLDHAYGEDIADEWSEWVEAE